MSAFAHTNLLDVEDSSSREGLSMRFARKHLDSEQLGVTLTEYAAGYHATRGHRHKVQEEAYVVVEGSGRVKLGDEVVDLKQWDVVRVAPTTPRAFEAGADGMKVIAIGGPKPEGGDGELVEDFWPEG